MDNYNVYIHIFPNSKVYIGITSQKPKRRWNNGQGYKNNQYMTNAIMKYGWDNVIHKILYTNLKKEEAEEIEIKLIKEYKADNKRYGYNILSGGNVSNGFNAETTAKMSKAMKECWKNEEYREKMRNSHLGKKPSKETREKMSKSNAKIWLGKHLSEETKEKISKNKKGTPAWNKGTKGIMKANSTSFKKGQVCENNCKKVKCIETNQVYNSLHSASRELNINVSCIMYVCKGKQKTAGGYHWKYI